MRHGLLLRAALVLAAPIVAWTLLLAYAGSILLLCTALALWRLWRLAAGIPGREVIAGADNRARSSRPWPNCTP